MADVPAYLIPGITISQPLHLEGDPSLATEILPGPPSLSSAQQPSYRREHRKPLGSVSYLPSSDPGSTYTGLMAGTTSAQDTDGPRRKRIRMEKIRATGRPQRTSARHMNGNAHLSDPMGGADSEPVPFQTELDSFPETNQPSISRSNSGTNVLDGLVPLANGKTRGAKRDKGKAKEIDSSIIRVKEEPKVISLHSPEPVSCMLNNQDHCSACRSQGSLVYCDGCPRAFHFWCLDPPMEAMDFPEGDGRWFCPSCVIEKNPPRKPPPSLFSPLIHHVQKITPVEFQLPDDIRTFFKDVVTGPRGAYVDAAEIRQSRINRLGLIDDRDAYRLKDRNGSAVLCFRCGKSALPLGLAVVDVSQNPPLGDASDAWKGIISCDYCNLHWHLDCLEPPLPNLPPIGKKWMCPNHADQLLHPKRRIPKSNPPLVEITKNGKPNNGNIEIIPSEAQIAPQDKLNVDEVLINGRRYRVPERVVILDFWDKVNNTKPPDIREPDVTSNLSSPLTSLASLGDVNEGAAFVAKLPPPDPEIVAAAELLCNMQKHQKQRDVISARTLIERAVQTEPIFLRQEQRLVSEQRVTDKMPSPRNVAVPNSSGNNRILMTSQSVPFVAIARRKRSQPHLLGDAKRELRSRHKARESHASADAMEDAPRDSMVINGLLSHASPPAFKSEPINTIIPPEVNGLVAFEDRSTGPSISVRKQKASTVAPKRRRPATKLRLEKQQAYTDVPNAQSDQPASTLLHAEASRSTSQEVDSFSPEASMKLSLKKRKIPAMPRKRKLTPPQPHLVEEKTTIAVKGKKRKEMDDSDREETRRRVEVDKGSKDKVVGTTAEAKVKVKRHHPTSSLSSIDPFPAMKVSTPSTPTLKIRLPRLSSFSSQARALVTHQS